MSSTSPLSANIPFTVVDENQTANLAPLTMADGAVRAAKDHDSAHSVMLLARFAPKMASCSRSAPPR